MANSIQANESDGSFHIRVKPLPVKKPKPVPQVEKPKEKKEAKK